MVRKRRKKLIKRRSFIGRNILMPFREALTEEIGKPFRKRIKAGTRSAIRRIKFPFKPRFKTISVEEAIRKDRAKLRRKR